MRYFAPSNIVLADVAGRFIRISDGKISSVSEPSGWGKQMWLAMKSAVTAAMMHSRSETPSPAIDGRAIPPLISCPR